MIAAIYESVIRPELYDAFMEAWGAHIQAALDEVGSGAQDAEDPEGLGLDPALQAHFARAYEILEQIGRKTPVIGLRAQVAMMPGFAVLVRSDGMIDTVSDAARPFAAPGAPLSQLSEQMNSTATGLLNGLMEAAQQPGTGEAPVVLAADSPLPRHVMARLAPMSEGDERQMLLLEGLDYQWSDQGEAMLVTSFGLSRAEVDVVRQLLAGLSLREIARASGKSEHTIRNQAKAVLAKTGAPGQVDLIRLVVFLINQDDRSDRRGSAATGLPFRVMKMQTGLEMQVFEAGVPTGRPVIFLHGMLDSISPLIFAQSRLAKRKLRVLAPVRPGFGLSDRVKRVDQVLDTTCQHVSELIAREKLKRPVILGHMAGGLYGHVLASRLRDQICGLVAVSAGPPVRKVAQLSAMAPRQRIVAYTARFAPALLPAVLRAGIAQIDSKDIDGFMEALYPRGTHEFNVIEALGLAEQIQAGFRSSVQQGHAGFAADSHFVVRDWSGHIAPRHAPALYLNGALDPVVSASTVVEAMKGQDNVEVRVLERIGQFVFYEEPELVLDSVEAMFVSS